MPKILFNKNDTEANMRFKLDFVEYDEDKTIGAGAIGQVFKGIGKRKNAEDVPVAIKLPATMMYAYRVVEEFEVLKDLAESIIAVNGGRDAHTPYVQLGETNSSERLPALVMPLYELTMSDYIRDFVHQGALLEADRIAIYYAIQLTYLLEGLHRTNSTATDRKLADYYLHTEPGSDETPRLVVIDWNMLKGDSFEERSIEMSLVFGQIWHELFLGRRNLDGVVPLDDQHWIPTYAPESLATPCIGLRFIIKAAIEPSVPGEVFNAEPEALRSSLLALMNFVENPAQIALLNRHSLGEHVRLTELEVKAIQNDLQWRHALSSGSDPVTLDESLKARETALEEARQQTTPDALLGAFESAIDKITEGDSYGAIDDIHVMQKERNVDSITHNRLSRWQLLAEALRDNDRRTEDLMFSERDSLLEIWYALDQEQWVYDRREMLTLQQDRLDDLLKDVAPGGKADSALKQVLNEVQLRLALLDYRELTDPGQRMSMLHQLESLARPVSHVHDHHEEAGLFNSTFDIDAERELVERQKRVRELITTAASAMQSALDAERYHDVEHEYRQARSQLAEIASTASAQVMTADDLHAKLENEVRHLRELASFSLTIKKRESAFSLAWKVKTGIALIQNTSLQDTKKAVARLLYPILEHAKNVIKVAVQAKTMTTVTHTEAYEAYQVFEAYSTTPEFRAIAKPLLTDDFRIERETYFELWDFFERYAQQLVKMSGTIRANPAAVLDFDDHTWKNLLTLADERGINMTDLISEETLQRWRELLSISEIVKQFDDAYEEVIEELEDKANNNVDEFKTEFDDLKQALTNYQGEMEGFLTHSVIATISHMVSAGTARATALDLQQARKHRDDAKRSITQASKLIDQNMRRTLQDYLGELDTLIEELEDPKLSQDFRELAAAARDIENGKLPELSPAERPIERLLQEHAHLRVIAMLQERYWALRIERAKTLAVDNGVTLTDTISQRKQQLIQNLEELEHAFYANEIKRAQSKLDELRALSQGDTLAAVLLAEVIKTWENRFENYMICSESIQRIAKALESESFRIQLTVEGALEMLDILLERMRTCPIDAFTEGLMENWKSAFNAVSEAYQALNEDETQMLSLDEYYREAERRVRKIQQPTALPRQMSAEQTIHNRRRRN